MRDIYLHGQLAEQFTPHLRLTSLTPREALSGVECAFPGFLLACKPMTLRVVYGDPTDPDSLDFDIDGLNAGLGDQPLHVIPVPEGSINWGKTILGIALLGIGLAGGFGLLGGAASFGATAIGTASFGISWGWLAVMGGGLILSSLASPQLSDLNREPVDQRPSYLYRGPVNTQEEGGPVPYLLCREIITGGKIIGLGVEIEQLMSNPNLVSATWG